MALPWEEQAHFTSHAHSCPIPLPHRSPSHRQAQSEPPRHHPIIIIMAAAVFTVARATSTTTGQDATTPPTATAASSEEDAKTYLESHPRCVLR